MPETPIPYVLSDTAPQTHFLGQYLDATTSHESFNISWILADAENSQPELIENVTQIGIVGFDICSSVCLTKAGYRPEVFYVRNAIQNESLTESVNIIANELMIGRDVDDSQELGDVDICAPKIIITADHVIFKNSTIIEKGTELLISNEYGYVD